VEYILAELQKLDVKVVRQLIWKNFGTIVRQTDIVELLPKPIAAIATEMNSGG
jgi:hypothetical protein